MRPAEKSKNEYTLNESKAEFYISIILTSLILLASIWVIFCFYAGTKYSDYSDGFFNALFFGALPGMAIYIICLVFQINIFVKWYRKNRKNEIIIRKIKKVIYVLALINITCIAFAIAAPLYMFSNYDAWNQYDENELYKESPDKHTQTPIPDEIGLYDCRVTAINYEIGLIKIDNCETVQGKTEDNNKWLEFTCKENCNVINTPINNIMPINSIQIGQKISVEKAEFKDGSEYITVYLLDK